MKVFIVDDEFLQRELVKKTIDWNQLQLEVIGEAEDGEEALAKALILKPDIVIMDINIPYMNGIEVSKRIKEELPDTQIIILTAYGEFEYAKQALVLGAVSFVLKPVNPVELMEELQKCRKKLEDVWEQRNSLKKMQEEITQKGKEQFLLEQMSGLANNESETSIRKELNMEPDDSFAILFLKFRDKQHDSIVIEEIEDLIPDYFLQYEYLEIQDNHIFLLVGTHEMDYQIQLFCAYLQEEMNQESLFYGGTSRVHKMVSEFREAYQEAYSSAKQGDLKGKIKLFEPVNMKNFLQAVSYNEDELLVKLRKREYDSYMSDVYAYFTVLEEKNVFPQAVYYVAADILVHFSLYMADLGIDFSALVQESLGKLFQMQENRNICEIKTYLVSLLKQGLLLAEKHKVPATKKKVQDARVFIDQNYYRFDLSLELVAAEIGVNASYLSNIFKKECGCSLSKYITSVRLEQARKQMSESRNKTLIEISESVGYIDVYYFSKNFKKQFGVTPSRYQEEKR